MAKNFNTYIILLRGVMPTGKNRVPMAVLREVLGKAGFENVRTYIASGNALVDSKLSAKEIESKVHELIKKHIGPDLVVVVRTAAELQKALDGNPFIKGYEPSRVFYMFFQTPPSAAAVKELAAQDFGDEEVEIKKNTGYLYIPGSAARSKLSNNFLEKKLGVGSTARNLNTVTKLIELTQQ
ncbi:MAG: DUF1697 domain-containing protein [Calditrichaeota bacterium]|nr:DUF1697 domain-containing protein [Calditrichota bacterium]MCB9369482.1 DUF1697 domain-containing protein [Calditrichota bacterium]